MDLQHLRASDGTGEAVLAHVSSPRTIGSTVLELDNVDNWNTKCIVVTGTPAANGYIAAAGMTIMYGHITAGDFIIDGYAPGYADNGNTTTQIAIVKMTTNWADALVDILSIAHQDNGKLKTTSLDDFFKPSEVALNSFVASGGVVAQTAGLTGSFSNLVYYVGALRYTKTGVANKVYTVSKDTYVDIGTDGTVDYNEVANGAAAPALAADHIRLAKVVTSGAAITSVVQYGTDSLNNPIYPRIVKSPSNYGLQEQFTGEYWYNGKPIYKKTVNFGALPSSTTKAVNHGITGLTDIVKYEGVSTSGSGSYFPLPFARTGGTDSIELRFSNTQVSIITSSTNFTSFSAYITIYYTKA